MGSERAIEVDDAEEGEGEEKEKEKPDEVDDLSDLRRLRPISSGSASPGTASLGSTTSSRAIDDVRIGDCEKSDEDESYTSWREGGMVDDLEGQKQKPAPAAAPPASRAPQQGAAGLQAKLVDDELEMPGSPLMVKPVLDSTQDSLATVSDNLASSGEAREKLPATMESADTFVVHESATDPNFLGAVKNKSPRSKPRDSPPGPELPKASKRLGVSVMRKLARSEAPVPTAAVPRGSQQAEKKRQASPLVTGMPAPASDDSLRRKLDDQEVLMKAFKAQLDESEERRKAAEETLAKETRTAKEELGEARAQVAKLRGALEAAETTLKEAVASAESQITKRFQDDVARLEAEKAEMAKKIELLEKAPPIDAAAATAEIRHLKDSLYGHQTAEKSAKDRCKDLEAQLAAVSKEKESLANRFRELQAQLKQAAEKAAQTEKAAAAAKKAAATEHARRVQQLEGRLAAVERSVSAKRVQELEKQVRELQEGMAKKHPTAIPGVSRDDGEALAKRENDSLKDEHRKRMAESEKRLLSLRTEHERLKAELEQKNRESESEAESARRLRVQLKEVSEQLESVRRYYREKVAALEDGKTKESPAKAADHDSPIQKGAAEKRRSPHRASSARAPRETHSDEARDGADLAELQQLRCELQAAKAAQAIVEQKTTDLIRKIQTECSSRIEELQREHREEMSRFVAQHKKEEEIRLMAVQSERETQIRQQEALQSTLVGTTATKAELERRITELEIAARNSELRRATVTGALQAAQMQLAAAESQQIVLSRELEQARGKLQMQDDTTKSLNSTVMARDAQIAVLRAQVMTLQRSIGQLPPRPPGMEEFNELECRVAETEAQFQSLLSEKDRMIADLRRNYERELAAKGAQVLRFRSELSQIIATVESRLGVTSSR